jgi:hypothetical protein
VQQQRSSSSCCGVRLTAAAAACPVSTVPCCCCCDCCLRVALAVSVQGPAVAADMGHRGHWTEVAEAAIKYALVHRLVAGEQTPIRQPAGQTT